MPRATTGRHSRQRRGHGLCSATDSRGFGSGTPPDAAPYSNRCRRAEGSRDGYTRFPIPGNASGGARSSARSCPRHRSGRHRTAPGGAAAAAADGHVPLPPRRSDSARLPADQAARQWRIWRGVAGGGAGGNGRGDQDSGKPRPPGGGTRVSGPADDQEHPARAHRATLRRLVENQRWPVARRCRTPGCRKADSIHTCSAGRPRNSGHPRGRARGSGIAGTDRGDGAGRSDAL